MDDWWPTRKNFSPLDSRLLQSVGVFPAYIQLEPTDPRHGVTDMDMDTDTAMDRAKRWTLRQGLDMGMDIDILIVEAWQSY